MASYIWIGGTIGDWNDANNWAGPDGPGVGIPGPGDTADIDGAANPPGTSATVTADGNTVGTVVAGSGGPGPAILTGTLTVTGDAESIIIIGGDITAATAIGVELLGGTLDAGTVDGAEFLGGSLQADDIAYGFVEGGTATATEVTGSTLSGTLPLVVTGGSFTADTVIYPTESVLVGNMFDVENGATASIGSATIGTDNLIGAGALGTGGGIPATVSGGLLTIDGNLLLDGGEAEARGGGTDGNGGTLAVGGSVDVASGEVAIGGTIYFGPQGAFVDTAPGLFTDAGSFELGHGGTASMLVDAAGEVTVAQDLVAGVGAGDLGRITLTDGSLDLSGGLTLGGLGQGALSDLGGAVDVGGAILMGLGTLPGTAFDSMLIAVGGGVSAAGSIDVGVSAGTDAQITLGLPGDTLAPTLDSGGGLIIGDAGTGELAVLAPLAQVGGTIVLGMQSGSSGTIAIGSTSVGAALAVFGDLIVGQDGTGVVLVQGTAAALTVDGTVDLGAGTGSGTIDAPSVIVRGDLNVNTGLYNVVNGLPLTVDGAIAVGDPAGSNGRLILQADAVAVAGTGDVTVGGEGDGVLTVNAGAAFGAATNSVTAADKPGSTGTITVTGEGALLQAATLTIGGSGTTTTIATAFLTIAAGGAADVGGSVAIGDEQGSYGQATITGDGSSLTATSLTVGGSGTGVLAVQPGADIAVGGDAKLGAESGGKGTWSINGGSADVGGTLAVGESGSGLAIVQLGGSLTADALEVGATLASKGELDITGSDSFVQSHDLTVGSAGKATLKIATGGKLVTTGDATMGEVAAGVVQSAAVDGQGAWNVNGDLTLGGSGIAALTVKGAGTVAVDGKLALAEAGGASGVLSVSGTFTQSGTTTASSALFGDSLTVGEGGAGTLSIQSGGFVGTVAGGTGDIEVAALAGSTGGITVGGTGSGSELAGGAMDLGGTSSAAGGTGKLTIGAGGTVAVADLHVWDSGSIKLQGGVLHTDPLTLDAGGLIEGAGTIDGAILDNGAVTAYSGALLLGGDVSGAGTLAVAGGGTLALDGTISSGIVTDFTGPSEILNLASSALLQDEVFNFGPGDTIFAGSGITGETLGADALTLGLADGRDIVLAGNYSPGEVRTSGDTATIPCFVRGTRIATPRGEVTIEDLREGDTVTTASGEPKPIVWIGRSRVDCRRHRKPEDVIPVCIRAGAFGPKIPARDLLLSPGHAIFAEGVLIPVFRLINGVSIEREEAAGEVTYYHLELPEHDVVLAEGLSAESYLDDGNRSAFENGGTYRILHPDYTPQTWDSACAPMRESGEEVAAVKRRLRERLEALGYEPKADRQVELWAGEIRLEPRFARGGLRHFRIPARCEELRLVSPRGIPVGFFDESADNRWLGVQLALVLLDGEWIPLDSPVLADGFYGLEQDGNDSWRWTNGEALLRLPPSKKVRLLELFVRDVMRSWKVPERGAALLAARA
jgi:T5SS/PEP-CTERM-associated repeat protein